MCILVLELSLFRPVGFLLQPPKKRNKIKNTAYVRLAKEGLPRKKSCGFKMYLQSLGNESLSLEYKIIRQGIAHRRKPLHSTGTQPSAKGQGTKISGKIVGVIFCSWARGRRQPCC